MGGHGSGTTGPDGRFEIQTLPKKSHRVDVFHAPFVSAQKMTTPGGGDLEFVLDPGDRLVGRVLDASSQPIEGAWVRWGPFYRTFHPGPNQVVTNARGQFELTGVTAPHPERLWVGVAHVGHAIHVQQPVSIYPGPTDAIEIQLKPARIISGRVLDGDGNPVANARVQVTGDRTVALGNFANLRATWEWCLRRDQTTTDADGRFRYTSLYPGLFRVQSFHPGHPLFLADADVEAGREDVELVLAFTPTPHGLRKEPSRYRSRRSRP